MTTIGSKTRWLVALGWLILAWMVSASTGAAQRIDETARMQRYTGVYVLPSGVRLAVDAMGKGLAVRPAGAALPEDQQEALAAFNSEAVLAGLAANQTAPLYAALRTYRRDRAVADITHLFEVFTEGHGPLESYQVLGTVPREGKRTWVLAHMNFEKGHEVIRLVWRDGQLATIQRGALYPASGTRYTTAARFKAASGSNITFNARADGTIESMTVAGRHGATIAYKLDDALSLK